MFLPYGVVLDVFGVQTGVKIYHRLKSPQSAVQKQKQQFELSVGGTVGETFL